MSTAARKEAILELTWDRVDFRQGTIDFNRSEKQSILGTSHIKGRAMVDMNETIDEALAEAYEYRDRDCPYVIEWKGKMVQDPKNAIGATFRRAGIVSEYMGRPRAAAHFSVAPVGLEN